MGFIEYGGRLLLLLLACAVASAQEREPRVPTFGQAPPWARESWFLRRQIEPAWALHGGTVIDVRTGEMIPDATVVIRGDRIESVGAGEATEDMEVIDVSGHYVIPGLFDLHAHVIPRSIFFPSAPSPEEALRILIDHGVTTIRLLPFHTESAAEWAGRVDTGGLIGPTIVRASGIFEKEAQRTSLGFGDPVTARAWVRKEALLGTQWIKVYNKMDEASLQAIVETARGYGMRVCGHTEDVPPHRAAALGIASIEHIISMPLSCMSAEEESAERLDLGARTARRWARVDDAKLGELFALLRSHRTAWVPTLVVSESMMLLGEHDERPFEGLDRELLEAALRKGAQAAVRFHREDGLVGLGTDFPVDDVPPGESVHRELELLVEYGGATPLEALQIATLGLAAVLGFEEIVGTIEPNRIAHLVVLRKNPLEDISNTREIAYVVHDGRRIQPGERNDPQENGD